MLTIRQEQIRAFERTARATFKASLVRHMRERWPQRDLPEVEGFVQSACSRAVSYSLTGMRDLQHFADLCADEGVSLEKSLNDTWLHAMLIDARVTSPSERLRAAIAESRRRARLKAHNTSVRLPALPQLPVWLR